MIKKKKSTINENAWERVRAEHSISYISQVGVTSVAALLFIGFLKRKKCCFMSDYFVWVCLTVGSSPGWQSICVWGGSSLHGAISTVELQLANSYKHRYTERHVRPVKRHVKSVVGCVLLPCLPHSPHQGHTGGWDLCVRPWRSWSSSCQISACTWNRRPPTGTHARR